MSLIAIFTPSLPCGPNLYWMDWWGQHGVSSGVGRGQGWNGAVSYRGSGRAEECPAERKRGRWGWSQGRPKKWQAFNVPCFWCFWPGLWNRTNVHESALTCSRCWVNGSSHICPDSAMNQLSDLQQITWFSQAQVLSSLFPHLKIEWCSATCPA